MKVKGESEKAGSKLNIQKTKIMASRPITSWQIDSETMETVTDFIFLGSKITKDGDYDHEIKRLLLLGRKAMTNLDSVLKGRDITLLTKVRLVKAIVFPVVMYGCGRPGFDPWVGKILWRRKWQSTPVLLPGKPHGQRSLPNSYSPWGCKESDTTEPLHLCMDVRIGL